MGGTELEPEPEGRTHANIYIDSYIFEFLENILENFQSSLNPLTSVVEKQTKKKFALKRMQRIRIRISSETQNSKDTSISLELDA